MTTLMRNGRDRRSENPFLGHAKKERVNLFGTDQRITSGPAAKRLHSKAEYMTAPERFADSQIPLAPRAPSIHDPQATLPIRFCGLRGCCLLNLPLNCSRRKSSSSLILPIGSVMSPTNERACGTCTMCCKVYRIPILNKQEGKWCAHCAIGSGCRIYEDRPEQCRSFVCLWLQDVTMPPEWKPEISKMACPRRTRR